MKNIIVYNTKTGFTMRYAEYLRKKLKWEMCDFNEIKKIDLTQYDYVVYGGRVIAGEIAGLKKMPRFDCVFAVGVFPIWGDTANLVKIQNNITDTPYFYLQGGIKYKEMKFSQRFALKMMEIALYFKPNKDKKEEFILTSLQNGYDFYKNDNASELYEHLLEVDAQQRASQPQTEQPNKRVVYQNEYSGVFFQRLLERSKQNKSLLPNKDEYEKTQ